MAVKALIKPALERLGLLDLASYVYSGHLKAFEPRKYWEYARFRLRGAPDGLPVPPLRFIWLVMGSIDISAFLETGRVHAHELIAPLLERNNLSMQNFGRVLDFGCGCGRIARHWQSLRGVELWGTDYNSRQIDWCRRNLPFAHFEVNSLAPPLPGEPERFDFVYARSVFTHLSEPLQFAWIRELNRVLRPGGVFLFTVSGDFFMTSLTPDELRRYQDGQLIVRAAEHAGRNHCAVYHPPPYVRQRWAQYGFEIIDSLPGGQVRYAHQDTYLARKTSRV